ncbi:unnamed protein product, partial [Rotaria sordida]
MVADQNHLINTASGWQDRIGIGHIRDINDYTRQILLSSFDEFFLELLDILLQRSALVDSVPFGKRAENNKTAGSTPLIDATKYNHPECVKHLLVHHANPNHKNHSSISVLILAPELRYFECVKLHV